jgi:hypothetical protein
VVQTNEHLFDFDKPLLTEAEANKIFSVTGINRKYEAAVRHHLEREIRFALFKNYPTKRRKKPRSVTAPLRRLATHADALSEELSHVSCGAASYLVQRNSVRQPRYDA